MEGNNNLFETLTEEQQLQVYELMAIANIEDGNVAAKVLIDANYDINVHSKIDQFLIILRELSKDGSTEVQKA